MLMSGVQGRDRVRDRPQPLGIFCEADTCPEYPGYWGDEVFDVLQVTKSGLLFGMVGPTGPNMDVPEEEDDCDECMPLGLRRTRFAL